MILRTRTWAMTVALAAVLPPLFAQLPQKSDPLDSTSKEAVHARMLELAREISALRTAGSADAQVAWLEAEYARLSASMGGDVPVHALTGQRRVSNPGSSSSSSSLVAPSACGATPVTGSFSGTTGGIGSPATPQVPNTFTTSVAGADPYLWDLNLNLAITHTSCADLDVKLQSPAGTIVTITTDSGGTLDNVFNGTLFDENVNDTTADHVYTNLVVATPLTPEGRLTAFRGENPNGVWTLSVLDDATANVGTLNSWSIDVTTLPSAPAATTTNFTLAPALPIPDLMTTISTITTSGLAAYLGKAELYLEITHTFASDLDITLTSPLGTVVKVTTDNGGLNDNVFNGTRFDPSSSLVATDYVYTNLVVVPVLAPEGSFDNFLGQDPNGLWTLTIVDDLGGDVGVLARWDLNLTTIAPPTPSAPANFVGTAGAITDNGGSTPAVTTGTFVFTAVASGLPTFLWDVDLNTTITHTFGSDLDITLLSPAGTSVTITTDNAGANDNTFNGTLWDDNANDPATDHVYTNLVTAPLLSPEGRLAAFRGENPNGTWTLTIVDDLGGDFGAVSAWSLNLAALASAPLQASNTFTQSPAIAISPTGTSTSSDTIAVSGLGTSITEIEVYVEIAHTNATDLDITLTSPTGTVVVLTTDNGGTFDNVFNGTLFDADVVDAVTDHVYVNLVIATPLSPEGSVDNFLGQDPNGNWRLDVADDLTANGGTFTRWDLTVRTCSIPPVTAFCFGDGTGTACPCGNSGAVGNGCASSLNANGANLATSGTASIGADTFTLLGTGMPNSSALYFQGTAQAGAGLGVAFGDGLRCAGGTIIRLGTKTNVAGASQYPVAGDIVISLRGANAAGDVRTYQCWYRNAAAFCTVSTFNLTNGMQATWVP